MATAGAGGFLKQSAFHLDPRIAGDKTKQACCKMDSELYLRRFERTTLEDQVSIHPAFPLQHPTAFNQVVLLGCDDRPSSQKHDGLADRR